MPLTPEQLAKIAQKDAVQPAALKRNASTNYYEGYFFITLNTRDYAPSSATYPDGQTLPTMLLTPRAASTPSWDVR